MPELPEVETTLRGIKPHLIQQTIVDVIIRHPQLRWPIPAHLKRLLSGQVLKRLQRRGKYLLFGFDAGTLILHLGMSGSVRVLTETAAPQKHDHVDICFANKKILRFTDPRRFGALLFTYDDPLLHPLLTGIGPEPLTADFNGDYLWQRARNKKLPVKAYIMDGKIVAGVGNIYAAEALFETGLKPQTPANKVSRAHYQTLVDAIKIILKKAIEKGGTTLKDFTRSDGTPGYFSMELQVYGRGGKPCLRCRQTLKSVIIGQRNTVYCPRCQK